ncbi:MAG: hypothetical protein GPJ27_18390 [Microcystis aeruginosa L111-01]|uniref:hypothetical protein n=1 Tax=unclassified Microcystis TaxID=2643300 RepID=UPI001D283E53|nr:MULTISPECIES: hypothetical protein [unclassified Microcystis]NCQ71477.1 hypothetical protein [Microcystis aeruginosa W13-16]NCQ75990.1 hypothetical protein [Microcystis aeruginosa W13-13]NCQ80487.1 hypothetical protein [Microcystis aeruginosa W13-15]NCR20053.1 hypothetical protein [Microcystis aeruginosa LL13-03]NCR23747.1 hypothetical protein [Microcystis aeruginosa L111-01]NCR69406.1 hypothetical protein [Microcystis aeruginosa LL11-07]NCS04806.1 hypothetical protein [Microcystis aerugi
MVFAIVFNGKAVVERRGFRPKIFDDLVIITQPSLQPVKIRANWEFFGKKVI